MNQLRAAERQFLIVAGMCAGRLALWDDRLTRVERKRSDAALWRELFVLLGLCGCGW